MGKILFKLFIGGFFTVFMVGILIAGWHWRTFRKTPPQPIAFKHTIHAGQLGMACTFCHIFVDKSPEAGAPTLETCMTCHQSAAIDRPEVIKVRNAYFSKKPVAWKRLHKLPGFIYFSHKRHVKAGVDCTHCHGVIKEMAEVRKVRPHKMGWCVTCHRGTGASTDCATCHK